MAEIRGTNVIAPVVPFSTTDVHPSHEARYGKGGYRTVATIVERDAIPAPRLEAGMLVHVVAEATAYQLGADLTTWAEFVTGSNPAIGDVTGLQDALDAKLALAGGAMDEDAVITLSTGTVDSEVGGWGFGVQLTADNSQFANVEPTGLTVSSGGTAAVVVTGITTANDGYINGIMGWGDPSGTLWSDLNGTYVRTSVAVRPSAYTDGNQGMHTPATGTYNYYLSNPTSMGSPSSAWNGIAYFLAPGNRSGWGDASNDGQTDQPVNYWRLCVLCDWPFTYFTNPSSNPYVFPTTGWVPVSAEAPNGNEGAGYNGADYLPNYGGGFSVSASGGSSHVSASAVAVTGAGGTTQLTPGHLTLPNGTQVMVGSFDNSTGGQGGISLICAVGNELNFQGGRLRNVQVSGDGTPQTIFSDSPIEFTGEEGNITLTGDGIIFPDGTQTVAWTGSFSYEDLDDLPTLFDGSYTSLTNVPATFAPTSHSHAWSDITSGVPSTFAPSAHKTSHATGGSDALTASDIGAAAASHTHALSSLTQSSASSGQVVTWNGSAWAAATPTTYSLPTASSTVLGGVKVGSGLSIDGSSVLSATYSYTLPAATGSTLGGVIVGTGLSVSSGTVSVSYGSSSTSACRGDDARLSDARIPTSHTHGNITNAGAIGSTSGQIVVTTTSGVLTTAASIASSQVSGLGSLATQSGTFSGTSSGTNTGDQTISLTGDVTGSGTGSFAATLASTAVAVGSYGSASSVSTFTVDAKGRLTAAGSTSIAIASGAVSGLAASATTDATNASNIGSGTLAIGRLPTPSTTQAQNASALYASTPAATLQQIAKWKIFDLGAGWSSNTVGSGSVFTNVIVQIQSGSTANSSYLLRLANEYYTMNGYANSASGYGGSTYWSRPEAFAFRILPNLASANGVFRWQFGKAQGTTTVGRMASAGIGIELQFVNSTTYRLWLLAHNGTSLTATDTSVNLRQNSIYDFVLSSDATGNVTALVNDGAVANYTTTGGPTSGGLGGITAEILNGTDNVGQSVHIYRYLFWTGLS